MRFWTGKLETQDKYGLNYCVVLFCSDVYCVGCFEFADECERIIHTVRRLRTAHKSSSKKLFVRQSYQAMSQASKVPLASSCLKISESVSNFYHASARVSILTRDIDIANMSVCLSVRPSVRNVPVSDENGLTYRHSFFNIR